MDATRLVVNEDLARRVATFARNGPVEWSSIALVREHTNEYKYGPLPVFRLAANDPAATLYFINADTGELAASSTRVGRLRMKIVAVHTFAFLLPELAPRTVNTLVAYLGAVGLLMSLFGGGILVLQFRNWFVARRRVA